MSEHALLLVQHEGAVHCVLFCGMTHAWLTTLPFGQLTATHAPATQAVVDEQLESDVQAGGAEHAMSVTDAEAAE